MTLNLEKLEQKRERGSKLEARCPACAELGQDTSGNHLFILDSGFGKWGCVVNPGPHGKEHRRRIAELAGTGPTVSAKPFSVTRPPPRPAPPLPPLRTPIQGELDAIAHVRGWPTSHGLETLAERGQLFTAEIFDDGREWPAWVVGDASQTNIQARKLDGGLWVGIGEKKAKSLPGTTTKRMIGAFDIGTRPEVWIMEGQPDFCAAPILANLAGRDLDQIAFTCITGAAIHIDEDDLHQFRGKRVTIAMHHDAAHGKGAEAARRWARQLYEAGAAKVVGFDFARSGCKDLSDHLRAACSASPASIPTPPPSEAPISPPLVTPKSLENAPKAEETASPAPRTAPPPAPPVVQQEGVEETLPDDTPQCGLRNVALQTWATLPPPPLELIEAYRRYTNRNRGPFPHDTAHMPTVYR